LPFTASSALVTKAGHVDVMAQILSIPVGKNCLPLRHVFVFLWCVHFFPAFDGTTLTVGDFTLWDLGRKRLAVHRITFPVSSMRRVLKYTRQGFYACNGALNSLLRATADNPELRTDIAYVD